MASVLADIEMLASAGDFASLARHCEAFELDLRHTEEPQPVSVAVYKVHLMAYLLTEQVDAARFLWKRMPAGTHALDPELAAIWEVGKQMWQKQPAGVQAALRSVPWSQPLVASLAARLQADTLQNSFKQMGAAYNTVAAPVLAQRLGARSAVGLPPPRHPPSAALSAHPAPPLAPPSARTLAQAWKRPACMSWPRLRAGLRARRRGCTRRAHPPRTSSARLAWSSCRPSRSTSVRSSTRCDEEAKPRPGSGEARDGMRVQPARGGRRPSRCLFFRTRHPSHSALHAPRSSRSTHATSTVARHTHVTHTSTVGVS